MTDKERDICIKAVMHFGADNQLLQACEELSELMQAISKAKRYTGQSYIDGVAEELADVEIMCEQIKVIFNISNTDVENERERKIKRLRNLIK